MNITKAHPLHLGSMIVAAVALGIVLWGCSLSTPDQKHWVRIELPQAPVSVHAQNTLLDLRYPGGGIGAVATHEAGGGYGGYEEIPTALSEFVCFGIHLSGPGILPDPRMQGCLNHDGIPMSKLGGLATRGGAIELMVPAGPSRKIELFALKSTMGCPNVDEILDYESSRREGSYNESDDRYMNLGEPYLVGTAMTDVFQDATIAIRASYDPKTARPIFENCGGGDQNSGGTYVPLAGVYVGEIPVSPVPSPTPTALPFPLLPASGVGAPELTNVVSMNLAELYPLKQPDSSTAISSSTALIYEVAGISATHGKRAVIQIQWDVTNFDLNQYPYVGAGIQLAGGNSNEAICGAGVGKINAGLYMNSGAPPSPNHPSSGGSGWRYIADHSSSTTLGWGGYGEAVSPLILVKNNGRKYVIMNVESTYVSTNSTCKSKIAVAWAGLSLKSQYSPGPTSSPSSSPTPTQGPASLRIGGNTQVPADYCTSYTVEISSPPSSDLSVNLSANLGGFYLAATCLTAPLPTTTITIPAGSMSSPPFYFKHSYPEQVYLNASGGGLSTSLPIWLWFNPAQMGNLQIWLEAASLKSSQLDNSLIGNWPSSASGGYPATQAGFFNQPRFISSGLLPMGYPVLRFDGTDDYLQIGAPPTFLQSQIQTLFVVGKLNSTTGTQHFLQKANIVELYNLALKYYDVSPAWKAFASAQVTTTTAVNPAEFHVFGLVRESAGTLLLSVDGSVTSSTGTVAGNANFVAIYIGANYNGGSYVEYLNGDIAEIIIYDGTLLPADRQRVECSLQRKYGTPFIGGCP